MSRMCVYTEFTDHMMTETVNSAQSHVHDWAVFKCFVSILALCVCVCLVCVCECVCVYVYVNVCVCV